jgi:hypothetical protein
MRYSLVLLLKFVTGSPEVLSLASSFPTYIPWLSSQSDYFGNALAVVAGVFIQSSHAGGDTTAPSSWRMVVRNTNGVAKSFRSRSSARPPK